MKNNAALSLNFYPRTYRGDMLFFVSSEWRDASSGMADWSDYVTGHITRRQFHGQHLDMMSPQHFKQIGPHIAAALSRTEHWDASTTSSPS
jgi:thioesterase domain-containing protein